VLVKVAVVHRLKGVLKAIERVDLESSFWSINDE
jgi:hypothetical protein